MIINDQIHPIINLMNDKGIFDRDKLLAGRPEGLHKGSAGQDQDGESSGERERQTKEVDIESMIDRSGCGAPYYELEECLGEHDRDWKKCQKEVRDLQTCSLQQNKARAKKE